MVTHTISEDQWIEFFKQFSRDHAGWATTIEVLDRESGPPHLAENLPLQGISFNTKGTRPCSVEIAAGDRPGRHVNHVMDLLLHIREVSEPDGSVDIQFEPANGPITLVHLRRSDALTGPCPACNVVVRNLKAGGKTGPATGKIRTGSHRRRKISGVSALQKPVARMMLTMR